MLLKPSPIFDDYWCFAFKRQEILRNQHFSNGEVHYPIDDPILRTYKFTNCYRATDRVSQFLIKNVIYPQKALTPEDTFLRILLFKVFNKIETWQWLESQLGEINRNTYSSSLVSKLLDERRSEKKKIYSPAYIMPSGKSAFGYDLKHENHLSLLDQMLKDETDKRIWENRHLKSVYETLLAYPSIGPFLAMQYAIDLAYSSFALFNESQFIVAGPGAIRGIKKCFDDIGDYSTSDVIAYMAENQSMFFERNELAFKGLKNRPLQLIDCQNLFCEFDKYCREKYPERLVGNTRIKQKYRPHTQPFELFFPPKWKTRLL